MPRSHLHCRPSVPRAGLTSTGTWYEPLRAGEGPGVHRRARRLSGNPERESRMPVRAPVVPADHGAPGLGAVRGIRPDRVELDMAGAVEQQVAPLPGVAAAAPAASGDCRVI